MKFKKLVCLLTTAVIAVSAFSINSLAYYDDSYSIDSADRTQIGSITYILKENVQYGDEVKVPYSATVVKIPNTKTVEIPEKVTYDGLEFLVTDVDLCGELFVHPQQPNIYPDVEEVILPESIYNITEFAYFPNIKKVNIPKNTAIGRSYAEGFVNYDYSNNEFIVDKTIYYSDLGASKVVFSDFWLDDQYGYFSSCPKLKLSVDSDNPYYSYQNDMLLSKDGKKIYMNFNHDTNITIPDGVESISSYGGFGFYRVKNVKLPNTLKYLGGHWSSITKITLPNGLEEIGYHAFSYTKLTKIVLPDSVKEIGNGAFVGSKLKSVKLGKNLTKIGNGAFRSCGNLKKVTIPDNVEEIGTSAFRNCKKLKSVKILSSNVYIGSNSFRDCKNLKSITINGAEKLISNIFNDCQKLSKITIKNKNKAPKILGTGGFKNTKNGLRFVVKNKKIAKQLKKQLRKEKRKLQNAKILVGKKVVYKI